MSDDFKILDDRSHILKRPAMYVGSITKESSTRFVNGEYKDISYVPALVKITNEVIDNSIDEAIRTQFKFASHIKIDMTETTITVEDNGRGIPQDNIIDVDGSEVPRPVAAWTKAKAGSNFSDDRVGIGANGVGSFCANVLSHEFKGVTGDGKSTMTVNCSLNAERIFVNKSLGKWQGTKVEFTPDFKRFGVSRITQEDIEITLDRIQSLAVAFPEITFTFNGKRIKFTNKQLMEMYNGSVSYSKDNVVAVVAGSDDFRSNSYANGVQTIKGGSHVDYFVNALCDAALPIIKRKHKITLPKASLKNGLTVVLFIRGMENLKFDSQTKETLTNTRAEVAQHLASIPYANLAKDLVNDESVMGPIIDTLLAKKAAEEARLLRKQQKEASRKRVEGHLKASKPKLGTLFLTEGKSAMNFFIKVRDREIHGGYALRGKVLNTWNKTPSKVMSNNELSDLTNILNLDITSKSIADLEYKDIAIMVDSDVDGKGDIMPSLIAFLYRWPELFRKGKVKYCKSPIVIAKKGKTEKWFYSLEDFENAKLSGYEIRYIKGLGSLKEAEYKRLLHEPHYDIIGLDESAEESLEMLFGSDSDKRKKWMMEDE